MLSLSNHSVIPSDFTHQGESSKLRRKKNEHGHNLICHISVSVTNTNEFLLCDIRKVDQLVYDQRHLEAALRNYRQKQMLQVL